MEDTTAYLTQTGNRYARTDFGDQKDNLFSVFCN